MTDFGKQGKQKERSIERDVDILLEKQPEELKRIRENREFLKKVEKHPIPKEKAKIDTFTDGKGRVVSVDLNAILKDNIRSRDCFVIDHLCKMFLEMTYQDLLKFRKKKRPIPFNYLWLLIIIIGIGVLMVVVFVVLPMLGL